MKTVTKVKQAVYVDRHKVEDPHDPIREWKVSERESKAPFERPVSGFYQALLPDTAAEARETLQRHATLKVLFDDRGWNQWDWWVWFNGNHQDANKVFGAAEWRDREDVKGKGFQAYLGSNWPCPNAAGNHFMTKLALSPEPTTIILKREWVYEWGQAHPEIHVEEFYGKHTLFIQIGQAKEGWTFRLHPEAYKSRLPGSVPSVFIGFEPDMDDNERLQLLKQPISNEHYTNRLDTIACMLLGGDDGDLESHEIRFRVAATGAIL